MKFRRKITSSDYKNLGIIPFDETIERIAEGEGKRLTARGKFGIWQVEHEILALESVGPSLRSRPAELTRARRVVVARNKEGALSKLNLMIARGVESDVRKFKNL